MDDHAARQIRHQARDAADAQGQAPDQGDEARDGALGPQLRRAGRPGGGRGAAVPKGVGVAGLTIGLFPERARPGGLTEPGAEREGHPDDA